MSMTVECTLVDKSPAVPAKQVNVKLECANGTLYIMPEGYGDACSEDGYGNPVMLEIWEGELRLVAWSDIKKEDPTHVVTLEGARESLRNLEESC